MISSVTVTFNPDILCLEKQFLSLQGQIDSAVIIDNGSRNYEEIKDLAEKFNFVLISFPENMGLSHAQNIGFTLVHPCSRQQDIGIENAISRGAEYLLLLDQDSVLGANFISAMSKMYTQNNVGILGPSFYDPHTNEFYWGTNYIGPFIKRTPIEEITDVTYVIASGSFFSSEVYEKVGKMEEALFVDYIDVEWALRAKKLGYRVAMTNQASMAHTIGDSRLNLLGRKISVHSPMRRYFLVRNSFFMIRKSYIPVGLYDQKVIYSSGL